MPLQDVKPGEHLGLRRGDAAVLIPVYGAYDLFAECLRSVIAHTSPEVPVLVCDDATPDRRLRALLEQAASERGAPGVYYLRQPENVGFVENVNAGIAASAPADVLILNSDCVVAESWFSALRAAAYSESRVATATALTNAGTIVSIPERNNPIRRLPDGLTTDSVAAKVRAASLRIRPDIPTCIGHCAYIRRSALELVGPFDVAFSPGYEEEVDFSQRCILRGMRHVLADDVFVFHHHAGSFGDGAEAVSLRERHHALITQRYPYYDEWCDAVAHSDGSPLARSLAVAAAAIRGTSVTIDGRTWTGWTGSQLVTLRAIAALDEHTALRLRVLVPDDLSEEARSLLAARDRIEVIRPAELERGVHRTDVVHRPDQVSSLSDLDVLRRLGRRIVLTQLDDVALRNPGYFPGFEQWREHRRLNRMALAAADQVVFVSRQAADDALTLGLLSEQRINVVTPEAEQPGSRFAAEARAPDGVEALAGRPFILYLGTDLLHENRLFALRLLAALVEEQAFDGVLVLAGRRLATGSSAAEEASYLLSRTALADRVVDLGAVDEAGQRWLMDAAAAVVYPTTYEGFGLTPFEAAQAGTPCLFAPVTSLADILPESAALLVPWDPRESARRAAPVLVAGAARDQLVHAIATAGARFTSVGYARGLEDVYAKAVRSPATDMLWIEVADAQRKLEAARGEVAGLRAITDDPLNRGLVGPDAVLPPELRRPALAVATRPPLRRAALALYRVAYAVRHRRARR